MKKKACNTIEDVILKLLTKDILTKKKRSLTKRLQSRMKTPNVYEDDNRFTRSKTKPFMKDHCFFCQSLDILKLHEIESLNTGKRLQSLIENSLRSELKVRFKHSFKSSRCESNRR